MPSWNQLLTRFRSFPDDAARAAWLNSEITSTLAQIGVIRGSSGAPRNVLFYSSAFLQKPGIPGAFLQLMPEEINGFMSTMHGMTWANGLTLILHTPGGVTTAAETVVEYLCSKFNYIEVVVPTFAMSAGTMIALGADRIVLGRQSQLGPIDPQIQVGGRFVSAQAIVDQFEQAKSEIRGDLDVAHAWHPVLQSLGPALLQESKNALDYGEKMVARWLGRRMFNGVKGATRLAAKTAKHFNDASNHKSHGRRIDRAEARNQKLTIEDLEGNQQFQDAVLTVYHLVTILFEQSPAARLILSHAGNAWVKNVGAGP